LPSIEKIDRSLRRFRRIEASWRSEIKRAHEASSHETLDAVKAKERFEKTRAKFERKISKLQPKIKRLTHLRAELKGEASTKG